MDRCEAGICSSPICGINGFQTAISLAHKANGIPHPSDCGGQNKNRHCLSSTACLTSLSKYKQPSSHVIPASFAALEHGLPIISRAWPHDSCRGRLFSAVSNASGPRGKFRILVVLRLSCGCFVFRRPLCRETAKIKKKNTASRYRFRFEADDFGIDDRCTLTRAACSTMCDGCCDSIATGQ